jgi:hypothetical protein
MTPADNHRDAALASVELNEEGFFLHPGNGPKPWFQPLPPGSASVS